MSTLTLTYYEVSGTKIRYPTLEAAQDRAGSAEAAWPVETTYHVGQRVRVHSFGRWRQGTVTKLGRTLVTVDYQSSAQGARRTKTFAATHIEPSL